MFCGNCGALIPEGSNFCEKCGADLAQMQANVNAVAADEDSPTVFADETVAVPEDTGAFTTGFINAVTARLVDMQSHESYNMTGEVMTIGKSSKADCQISGDTTISRMHAVISLRGHEFYLKDNGSLNGTFINGVPVKPGQEIYLRNGDMIRLSDKELMFEVLTQ